jgi:hypothetical protein
VAEAGIPLAAVGVEDPERRPPARRAGPVAGHDHLCSLSDHVAAEADPRAADQLETDPGRLANRAGHARRQAWWLQDRQADPRPAGERAQPTEAVGDLGATLDPLRQVDDEEVDRPTREERTGDRDSLVDVRRRDDHEPLRLDASGEGLDRIERGGEIEPGHDRARCLGLRDEPQGNCRPAAREVAPERDPHAARQAARPEDRVQGGEPGREDPSGIGLRFGSRDIELVIA